MINNEYLKSIGRSLDSFQLQDENISFEPASKSQDLLNRISVVIKKALLFCYTLWLDVSWSWYSKSVNLKRLANIPQLLKDGDYSDIASMFSSRLLASGNSSKGSYISITAAFIARSLGDLFDKKVLSNVNSLNAVKSSTVELIKIIRDTTHQLSETDNFWSGDDAIISRVDQRLKALQAGQIQYFSFDAESHQMVLSIQKMKTGKYTLNIFNTGNGINHHHKRKMGVRGNVYRISLTVTKVEYKKCHEFLRRVYTDSDLSIRDLYTSILPKIGKVVKRGALREYDSEQMGNDCTVRVFLGCLKDQVRKRQSKDLLLQYKAFKLRLRIDLLLQFLKRLTGNGSTRKDVFSLHEIAMKILSQKNKKLLSDHILDQIHLIKSKCESSLFSRKDIGSDKDLPYSCPNIQSVDTLADSLIRGDFIRFRSVISKVKRLVNNQTLSMTKKSALLRPILNLDMRQVMGFRSVEMILGIAQLFQSIFTGKKALPGQIKNYITGLNRLIINAKVKKTIL